MKKVKKGNIDLKGYLKSFLDDSKEDPYHRYGSFHICYDYFKRHRGNQLKNNKERLETSCVYLASYLASWGMYRGSTTLLQKNAMCLSGVINFIAESSNDNLRKYDLNRYKDEKIQRDILRAYEGIRIGLIEGGVEWPTETLITKIMLGVWACVPAFDTYFNEGMQKYWGKGFRSAQFANKVKKIAEFCDVNTIEGQRNLEDLRALAKKYGIKMAKVLDMCFFKAGVALYE